MGIDNEFTPPGVEDVVTPTNKVEKKEKEQEETRNFNDEIKLKLNDKGRKEYLEYYTKLFSSLDDEKLREEQINNMSKKLEDDTDEEGYTKIQMSRVMIIFGPSMVLGGEPPFEMTYKIPAKK